MTVEQLRNSRAIAFCDGCSIQFDALELLSDTADDTNGEIETIEAVQAHAPLGETPLPWEQKPAACHSCWHFGTLFALLLLAVQAVYFEGVNFSQSPRLRPSLEKLCRTFHCDIPVYKNLDEFTVMQGAFTPLPNGNYTFRAVISNQASFAQDYPNIQLVLQDYTGRAFTERIFRPQDYLSAIGAATKMLPDATIAINLEIAAPKTRIGGYNFELTY
ncbi:MAG: DUF3426 domain-containing protein [Methylococcaceae bacterium]